MPPTLDELRANAAKAAQDLADAEAAIAALPLLTEEEVAAIFSTAVQEHSEAQTPEDRHIAALKGLQALEGRNHKGREIDILAQHVLDAREA